MEAMTGQKKSRGKKVQRKKYLRAASPEMVQSSATISDLLVEGHTGYAPKSKAMSRNSEISKLINSMFGREKEDLNRIAAQEHKIFSYATLAAATDNFADSCMLGKGGYGSVYKGMLKDGRMVAVKMLSDTSQGTKEFVNEAELMTRLQHRNVVKLLGYGAHRKKKFLVSEFVPNNNLAKLLSDSNGNRQLDWPRRYAIIQGIAYGLLYLHGQHSHKSIIHRDIKLENILIDENWNPKIADFGLSRVLKPNQSHVKTKHLGGTCGYIAPELCFNPNATPKADVYSLGVTILEIISGQRISKSYSTNGSSLVDQAYDFYLKRLEFMDHTLETSAIIGEVKKCTAIGLLCTQGDPESRPDMKEVVLMLEDWCHVERAIGKPGLRGYDNRFRINPDNFNSTSQQSQLLQDASIEVTIESEITDHSEGVLLSSSQPMQGDPSASSFSSHVQADNGHGVYAPKFKIMKIIWNPVNSILGREEHEELKKIDAERPQQFSYKTLLDATVGFADNHKIGQGGFGCVYKGELKDGREVAVKVLRMSSAGGTEQFINEAMMMNSLQHRNVAKLLGYCAHEKEGLLVYEFVSNNSLDQHLFGFNGEQLDWSRRYGIIRGIAWGLRYLHQHSPKSIIHADIKPNNILIDEQWQPKISDFGLSYTLQPYETESATDRIRGTYGYMAPEYLRDGIITQKIDVYSLGVTILAIIRGKRLNKIYDFDRNMNIDEAYELYQEGRSLEFMDRTLEASAVAEEVDKCIAIGLLCVQEDSELRPDMKDVVFMLEIRGHVERTIGRPAFHRYNDSFDSTSQQSQILQDATNPDSPIFMDSDDDIILPR